MNTPNRQGAGDTLDQPEFARVEALFHHVAGMPTPAREAYLAGTEPDERVRAAVRRLLLADAAPDDELARLTAPADPAPVADGAQLGPWRVVRELGSGGMGTVFEALRADGQFEARVAIKVMRGFPTSEGRARLRQERQILAELDHPNIARLLDGGETAQGQPYIVMEFVPGATLGDWLATHALDRRQRLALFDKIVAAAMHAHQRLVIHRDIKPGNVMVREDGEPKLLDFGVAKLIDLSDATPERHTSTRVSTPGYGSPEQRAGLSVTTATDVYSLGVLLKEILGGLRPLDGDQVIAPRWAPVALDADLRGIIARAASEDPAQRYPTAEALLDDLQRYREGRPVRASRATRMYRLRKFLLRHRVSMALAAVATVALVAFVWRLGAERDRARVAEAAMQAALQTTDRQFRVLAEIFAGAGSGDASGQAVSAIDLLDRAQTRISEAFATDLAARGEMERLLGDAYLNAGRYSAALPLYAAALEHTPASAPVLDRLILMRDLARMQVEAGRPLDALDVLDRAQALMPDPPADPQVAAAGARIWITRIGTLRGLGDPGLPEQLDRALAYAQAHMPRESVARARLLAERGYALEAQGRYLELVALRREVLAAWSADPDAYRRDIAFQRMNLAKALRLAGDYDEALRVLDDADADFVAVFGTASSVGQARAQFQRAAIEHARGDLPQAELAFVHSLEIYTRVGETPATSEWMLGGTIAAALERTELARQRYGNALGAASTDVQRASARQALDGLPPERQ